MRAATSLPVVKPPGAVCGQFSEAGGRGLGESQQLSGREIFPPIPNQKEATLKFSPIPKQRQQPCSVPWQATSQAESWPTPSSSDEEGELLALDPSAFENEGGLKIPVGTAYLSKRRNKHTYTGTHITHKTRGLENW